MRSMQQLILCLLALVLAAQAKIYAQPDPMDAIEQARLNPQVPAGVPGGPQPPRPKIKAGEEPKEDIVDHIAKACPGHQPQVDRIREEIQHANQFCKFFLSGRRSISPIAELQPDLVMKGCVCLLREDGMGITSSSQGPPTTFVPAQTSSPGSGGGEDDERPECDPALEEVIKNEYREPRSFCKFLRLTLKRISPIPGLTADQVSQGCKCILEDKRKTASRTSAWTKTVTSESVRSESVKKEVFEKKDRGEVVEEMSFTTTTVIVKTIIVSTK